MTIGRERDTSGTFDVITHDEKIGPEERAKYQHRMTPAEFIAALRAGHAGPLLLSRRGNPDDNVVVEYVRNESSDDSK